METRLCWGSCRDEVDWDRAQRHPAECILNQTIAGVTDILGEDLDRIAGKPAGIFYGSRSSAGGAYVAASNSGPGR